MRSFMIFRFKNPPTDLQLREDWRISDPAKVVLMGDNWAHYILGVNEIKH